MDLSNETGQGWIQALSGVNKTFQNNMTVSPPQMEDESDLISVIKSNINAMYLVIMGSIIIFMQAGFGFLEAGSIRAKNTTNILIKNFADLTFGKYIYFYYC